MRSDKQGHPAARQSFLPDGLARLVAALSGSMDVDVPMLDGRQEFPSHVEHSIASALGAIFPEVALPSTSNPLDDGDELMDGGMIDYLQSASLDALTAACQQPEGAVEMRLPAGAAVLWRTAVWHCVGPQTSNIIRKIIHIGYHHRWLRPTDYTQQATALLARSSPVRRQLLGAMPEGHDPMGSHGDADWAPASKYWQPHEDDVPLRAEAKRWAQASEATARL